jgi:hypothetical protein
MSPEGGTRECPYCKEEIKADAVKCKHCRSAVKPKAPAHGGTCPYCKEAIKPDAIKCKHCGSMVGSSMESSCCDGHDQMSTSLYGASAADLLSILGKYNPLQSLAGAMAASPTTCSECAHFGATAARWRVCCRMTYIPLLGYVKVCWPEPCLGGPGGTIIT